MFIPFLRENGFEVTVSGTTESYLDLDGTDLVLQCVTMSEIPAEHLKGLVAEHPIVEGIKHFDVHTEQYYIHYDPTNTVLATTQFESHPDYPWIEGAVMPAIWTRAWGEGKVFVCTVGHKLDDLEVPEVRTIIERGLLWASK